MKAFMVFNLPEDQYEYELCVAAPDMRSALEDIREYLRGQVKYLEPEARDNAATIYERVLDFLSDIPIMDR